MMAVERLPDPSQCQKQSLKEHNDQVGEVALFLMFAPQVSINLLRSILLEEGIELMIGPAQQTTFFSLPPGDVEPR